MQVVAKVFSDKVIIKKYEKSDTVEEVIVRAPIIKIDFKRKTITACFPLLTSDRFMEHVFKVDTIEEYV